MVEKNKGGRPRKEIDKKTFENLCGIQCTKSEICAVLDVTDKTLENWCKRTYKLGFSDVFRIKREIGKVSLRRSQMRLAEKNASMAIFLGKNYLGQTDTVEQNVNIISDDTREQVSMLIDEIDKRTSDSDIEDNSI